MTRNEVVKALHELAEEVAPGSGAYLLEAIRMLEQGEAELLPVDTQREDNR